MEKEQKQMSLEEYIKNYGYTKEEWNKTFEEIASNGIDRGCFQDFNLLTLVINWNCNSKSIFEVNKNE